MPVCDLANSHSLTQEISAKLSKMRQEIEKSSVKSRISGIDSSDLANIHV